MVKKKKPAPDVYLMAVEEMGLDKEKCVVIEDSHIGVGSAVAAGISCLVTKSSYTANEGEIYPVHHLLLLQLLQI